MLFCFSLSLSRLFSLSKRLFCICQKRVREREKPFHGGISFQSFFPRSLLLSSFPLLAFLFSFDTHIRFLLFCLFLFSFHCLLCPILCPQTIFEPVDMFCLQYSSLPCSMFRYALCHSILPIVLPMFDCKHDVFFGFFLSPSIQNPQAARARNQNSKYFISVK